jgi:hypothetical protein
MRAHLRLPGLAVSTSLLLGCGDDPAASQPPQADEQDLVTQAFTLDPGQERYLCYTFRSPSEKKAIVRVEPIQGASVHHVALFRTTSPEADGSFECPEIIRLNWEPIWAGGAGANALDVPDDAGFIVEPGTQYLAQYHLQNTTSEPVKETSTIRLTYADDINAVTPAGIFALGGFSLTIPPLAAGFEQTVECSPTHELNVFAVFPHMHKLGRSMELVAGKTQADAKSVYSKDPWVFGEQPLAPVDLNVAPGDYVRSTCRWDNPNPTEVKFGESTDDEMCFTVMFYYPFTGLDGCINP